MATILFINLAIILGLMTLLWLASVYLRDVSIVDPFWGTGFVILGWVTAFQMGEISPRSGLLLALVSLWGVRLSIYLLLRNAGSGEDRRYQAMRRRGGDSFWRDSWLRVFVLQGVLLWIIGMPIQVGQGTTPLLPFFSWLDGLGVLIFAIGFLFESFGDAQLARFKRDPANKGKVMDRGLWGWTRHPNYFGDFCVWWGLYLMASAGGAGWTFFGPLLMSFFLLRVSGVTLLERDIAERRPEYLRYQQRTSSFIPWPPRND